jgi:GT2 family glycosyltransferase
MQKDNTPLVSLITLNWNNTSITCDFLESTRKLDYKKYEILVCDMNSDIDPTEQISKGNYPNTVIIKNAANLGFAMGNNWGMQFAKGDYIFIVNNDTIVTPDLLDLLLEPFKNDPLIGVTCPKIRFFYNPNVIQYAGFKPMNVYTGRTGAVGSREEDNGQHDTPGYTANPHGCAMMVKREVIEKSGKFPENFFLYYDEWDWGFRIVKAGYKIYYQAKAVIYHKESMTVGKQSPGKLYHQTRNRIMVIRRNAKWYQYFIFVCFFFLFTVPKSTLKYGLKRQFNYLKKFYKGMFEGLSVPKFTANEKRSFL